MSANLSKNVRYVVLVIAAAIVLVSHRISLAQTQADKSKSAEQKTAAASDAKPKEKPKVTVVPVGKEDEAAIKAQATCPVSGEKLGSMGDPIKVLIGDKSLYLCCSGCLSKVESDPELYLGKVAKKP
jgi:hypothetical protein